MSKKQTGGNISGKGYYIALVLCALAIGITGYLYYRHDTAPAQLQDPTAVTGSQDPTDRNVQAVATQPGGEEVPTTQSLPGKPEKTVRPVSGKTAAAYSMEGLAYNQTTRDWRTHNGVDIAAAAGTVVSAAADGTVYTVYEDDTMGMTVVISHESGYTTHYSSLGQEVSVKAGDPVTAGQTIGKVGNTSLLENAIGDHLHFSVTCNGDAVDPESFLN